MTDSLRSAINTFIYDGSGSTISAGFKNIQGSFATWYFEVFVFYGSLVETLGNPLRPSMLPPGRFPVMPALNVKAYRDNGSTKVEELNFLGQFPVYDTNGNVVGAKLVFNTEPILTSDTTVYTTAWRLIGGKPIEINDGFDYIQVNTANLAGVSASYHN